MQNYTPFDPTGNAAAMPRPSPGIPATFGDAQSGDTGSVPPVGLTRKQWETALRANHARMHFNPYQETHMSHLLPEAVDFNPALRKAQTVADQAHRIKIRKTMPVQSKIIESLGNKHGYESKMSSSKFLMSDAVQAPMFMHNHAPTYKPASFYKPFDPTGRIMGPRRVNPARDGPLPSQWRDPQSQKFAEQYWRERTLGGMIRPQPYFRSTVKPSTMTPTYHGSGKVKYDPFRRPSRAINASTMRPLSLQDPAVGSYHPLAVIDHRMVGHPLTTQKSLRRADAVANEMIIRMQEHPNFGVGMKTLMKEHQKKNESAISKAVVSKLNKFTEANYAVPAHPEKEEKSSDHPEKSALQNAEYDNEPDHDPSKHKQVNRTDALGQVILPHHDRDRDNAMTRQDGRRNEVSEHKKKHKKSSRGKKRKVSFAPPETKAAPEAEKKSQPPTDESAPASSKKPKKSGDKKTVASAVRKLRKVVEKKGVRSLKKLAEAYESLDASKKTPLLNSLVTCINEHNLSTVGKISEATLSKVCSELK